VFVEPDGADIAALTALGLIVTHRRTRNGQGTKGMCVCFHTMFLACSWASDVGSWRAWAWAASPHSGFAVTLGAVGVRSCLLGLV
jgi:hypothetical protein